MKLTGLIPATDWFFVFSLEAEEDGRKYSVQRLAAWALTEEGEVTGLVSVSDPRREGLTARLIAPPPEKGQYLHLDQLTPAMSDALRRLQG